MTTAQNSSQNSSEQPSEATQPATQTPASHQKPGSANPDHQGGKVESAQQPTSEGTVAATEAEKGGSSE
jgi:hypothetical protein